MPSRLASAKASAQLDGGRGVLAGATGIGEPALKVLSGAYLLLLDEELPQRLTLAWPLVPATIREGDSFLDLCDAWAAIAGCEPQEASRYEGTLRSSGLLLPDGRIADSARQYLEMKAMARVVGLGGADPEVVAIAFVSRLSSEALAAWLEKSAPAAWDGLVTGLRAGVFSREPCRTSTIPYGRQKARVAQAPRED